ncbi:MAG: hypothetical protein LC098_04230 [Burkholderiales bacterium]|nr:hypothetical protein [Burkholderiales bacterium]
MKTTTRSPEPTRERRAAIRMVDTDFKRLNLLRVDRELSWQSLLTEAVDAWLKKQGEKPLEPLK